VTAAAAAAACLGQAPQPVQQSSQLPGLLARCLLRSMQQQALVLVRGVNVAVLAMALELGLG